MATNKNPTGARRPAAATGQPTPGQPAASDKVSGPASYFPSIENKYGRPIAEWKQIIRATSITKHMQLVTWLKTEHGIGHGHANALVGHTLAETEPAQDH